MNLKRTILALGLSVTGAMLAGHAGAETRYLDLTHPIPTFEPLEGKPTEADLTKPLGDSKPIPSFFPQAVFEPSTNPMDSGHFYRGILRIAEHHGTHVDAPSHYVNTKETLEKDAVPIKFQSELTLKDLTGPIVYIDISKRVQNELDKNNGVPSPDINKTNFSESSENNVTVSDINAVADKLQDGSWLVVNSGWDKFFVGQDLATSPYVNGWNFPGVSKAALDRLIEIEDQKGFRVNGIATDNLGIDAGETERGEGDQWNNSYHSHVRGLQRGWKFVENIANLDSLSAVNVDDCTMIIGALPIEGGSGSPARIIAACN
ncbi:MULTISPECIES: cyclase family protein [unclassified Rhizobium]|uniref:cyclase family protein n=1 Tax=unclassified Rhizobium TaxID=2613769 RepID=UPI00247B11C0|nr:MULTISPECIES: cyclase family protein [unclassified Rhizobium]MDH7804540.1 kynurenine formamidase [Rhizobium sp. AN70]